MYYLPRSRTAAGQDSQMDTTRSCAIHPPPRRPPDPRPSPLRPVSRGWPPARIRKGVTWRSWPNWPLLHLRVLLNTAATAVPQNMKVWPSAPCAADGAFHGRAFDIPVPKERGWIEQGPAMQEKGVRGRKELLQREARSSRRRGVTKAPAPAGTRSAWPTDSQSRIFCNS